VPHLVYDPPRDLVSYPWSPSVAADVRRRTSSCSASSTRARSALRVVVGLAAAMGETPSLACPEGQAHG